MGHGSQLRAVSDAVLDFANQPPSEGHDHDRGNKYGEGIPGGDQDDDAGEKQKCSGHCVVGSRVSVAGGLVHVCLA
jgi:hypothetical protein